MREDIKLAVSMSGNSDTLGNTERATEAFNAFVTKLIDPERFRIIAEKYGPCICFLYGIRYIFLKLCSAV